MSICTLSPPSLYCLPFLITALLSFSLFPHFLHPLLLSRCHHHHKSHLLLSMPLIFPCFLAPPPFCPHSTRAYILHVTMLGGRPAGGPSPSPSPPQDPFLFACAAVQGDSRLFARWREDGFYGAGEIRGGGG